MSYLDEISRREIRFYPVPPPKEKEEEEIDLPLSSFTPVKLYQNDPLLKYIEKPEAKHKCVLYAIDSLTLEKGELDVDFSYQKIEIKIVVLEYREHTPLGINKIPLSSKVIVRYFLEGGERLAGKNLTEHQEVYEKGKLFFFQRKVYLRTEGDGNIRMLSRGGLFSRLIFSAQDFTISRSYVGKYWPLAVDRTSIAETMIVGEKINDTFVIHRVGSVKTGDVLEIDIYFTSLRPTILRKFYTFGKEGEQIWIDPSGNVWFQELSRLIILSPDFSQLFHSKNCKTFVKYGMFLINDIMYTYISANRVYSLCLKKWGEDN